MPKKQNHYVNNKEFYRMLVDYKKQRIDAENSGEPEPKIPDELGTQFLLISTHLSNKANFTGYTYKDEMVGDAIENCIKACKNFDPDKSNNPFGYFTRTIWNAFLRRIEKEKRQTYVKYKELESLVIASGFQENQGGNGYSNYDLDNEKMKPIIEKYETKNKSNKKPAGVEKYLN
jgi:hypothetical protein